MKLIIQNSFCKFEEITPETKALVGKLLTYQVDIQAEKAAIFFRMGLLKKKGPKPKPQESPQAKDARARQLMGFYQKQLKELEVSEWVYWFKDNQFPTGHLAIVQAALKSLKAICQIEDLREKPPRDLIFKWANQPHSPRYYQKDSITAGLKAGRGIFEEAVGTGKSLILAYILKSLSVRSLIVVPSRGLSDQIYQDFRNWFGNPFVELVDSKKVRSGNKLKAISIITIQSLASLQKSGDLGNFLGDVKALFVDEIHHAGSASYTNLMPELNHIFYRFGFTGTFIRNDHSTLDMWGFLSHVIYRYPAKQAIQEGFLTPLEIKVVPMGGKLLKSYPKEYSHHYLNNSELFDKVLEICQKHPQKQILILVNRKDKGGNLLHEYLTASGLKNVYISGDNKKEEITEAIRSFNAQKINILIGSKVIGEGIDIQSTDYLLMCQGGKSEIAIVQALGRAVRLFEGKKVTGVYDFDFEGTKYMSKHLKMRLAIYERNFGCEIDYIRS